MTVRSLFASPAPVWLSDRRASHPTGRSHQQHQRKGEERGARSTRAAATALGALACGYSELEDLTVRGAGRGDDRRAEEVRAAFGQPFQRLLELHALAARAQLNP